MYERENASIIARVSTVICRHATSVGSAESNIASAKKHRRAPGCDKARGKGARLRCDLGFEHIT